MSIPYKEDPYCTIEDVWRETRNAGPELTEKYIDCIDLASRYVEDYCRRDFKYHVYEGDDFYRVNQRAVLLDEVYLPFPILELNGLWVHDHGKAPAEGQAWESSDYFYTESQTASRSSIRTANNSLQFGEYPFRQVMSLQGKFGYTKEAGEIISSKLPSSIRKATAVIAATISVERRLEQTNLEGNRIELIELIIPRDTFDMLKRFRNFSFMI